MDDSRGVGVDGTLFDLRPDVHSLAEEVVGGLADVHPVAWKLHLVKLLLAGHDGEYFPLNRGRSVLNPIDDLQVEDVKAGIDLVADERSRLFDEALNLPVFFGHHHAVARGVLDASHHDRALAAVALVVGHKLVQRVLADDIRVEDEEETAGVVFTEDAFGKSDGAGGAQGFALQRDRNFDTVLTKRHAQQSLSAHVRQQHPWFSTPERQPSERELKVVEKEGERDGSRSGLTCLS